MHIEDMRPYSDQQEWLNPISLFLSCFSMAEAPVLWMTYALAAAQSCLAVSERNRGLRREPIPL